jgi:hypothetical protein
MTNHDLAAIAVAVFVFVFTFIPSFNDRKSTTTIRFTRGLMKYYKVPQKPYSALRAFGESLLAALFFGGLVWWGVG